MKLLSRITLVNGIDQTWPDQTRPETDFHTFTVFGDASNRLFGSLNFCLNQIKLGTWMLIYHFIFPVSKGTFLLKINNLSIY